MSHAPPSISPWLPPPALRPGDAVAVVAPAGPVPEARLEAGLRLLAARYRVVHSPGLLSRDGYLAGDDGRRLAELRWALSDPSVRAVFCARGGYGVTRLLSALLAADPSELPPRPLVGFSDITALHALCARARRPCVHGPVVTQLGDLPTEDHAALFALLESPAPPPPLAALTTLLPGAPVTGRLLGGNLEVLSRLAGTALSDSLRPGEPVLLLLEEVGERPYRIDRSLTQMLQAGMLRDVVGVVLGDLVRCEEPPHSTVDSPSALAVLRERLATLGIPVAYGAPLGHGSRNRAVPLGALVTLDTSSAGAALHFHQGAVS